MHIFVRKTAKKVVTHTLSMFIVLKTIVVDDSGLWRSTAIDRHFRHYPFQNPRCHFFAKRTVYRPDWNQ